MAVAAEWRRRQSGGGGCRGMLPVVRSPPRATPSPRNAPAAAGGGGEGAAVSAAPCIPAPWTQRTARIYFINAAAMLGRSPCPPPSGPTPGRQAYRPARQQWSASSRACRWRLSGVTRSGDGLQGAGPSQLGHVWRLQPGTSDFPRQQPTSALIAVPYTAAQSSAPRVAGPAAAGSPALQTAAQQQPWRRRQQQRSDRLGTASRAAWALVRGSGAPPPPPPRLVPAACCLLPPSTPLCASSPHLRR